MVGAGRFRSRPSTAPAKQADPFAGVVYVFRAKRADSVKLLFWEGIGLVLVTAGPPLRIALCACLLRSSRRWRKAWTGYGCMSRVSGGTQRRCNPEVLPPPL